MQHIYLYLLILYTLRKCAYLIGRNDRTPESIKSDNDLISDIDSCDFHAHKIFTRTGECQQTKCSAQEPNDNLSAFRPSI